MISGAILSCQVSGKTPTSQVITVIVTGESGSQASTSTEPPEMTTPSPEPAATETPAPPTITPTIAHTTRPDKPESEGYHIWDSNSSSTAAQHRPQGGEYFDRNMFERPFNAQTQDVYFPDVDILQAYMDNETPWAYAKIDLKGNNTQTNKMDATYAVELDIDMDGRGDYLVTASSPNSTDWSTDGVQVYKDENKDVGGKNPMSPDGQQTGDGYESLVFDQGRGDDPDLAWARLNPSNSSEVWIAFNASMIGNAQQYLWGVWAQQGGLHPEWFDYNDHFTLDQAGSPFPNAAQYPLKELAEMDNTCRWAVGFNPTGDEPGICPIAETATPKPAKNQQPTESIPRFIITLPRFHLLPTNTPVVIR
jgi:hypothetical protein